MTETTEPKSLPLWWRLLILGFLGVGLWWWLGGLLVDVLWYTGWQLGLWMAR
jgi:hypothetical protein